MTPLLRWGKGLLKLELLGSPRIAWPGSVSLSGNQALAAAQTARGKISLALLGMVTHEMREALRIWGATILADAPQAPDLREDFARTLGAELKKQIIEPAGFVVAPGAESSALAGAAAALGARAVALVAEDAELPDLPHVPEDPEDPEHRIELVRVSRQRASEARARLARELGLLAGHASAAAADYAREHGGIALVTGPGEREFSIE